MEDINILEDFLEYYGFIETAIGDDDIREFEIHISKNEYKAIENLIARNKELIGLLNGVEIFRENNFSEETNYVIALKSSCMSYLKTNYIPKSKIKEKIKELENSEPSDDDYNFEVQNDIHSKINILQELLEENKNE